MRYKDVKWFWPVIRFFSAIYRVFHKWYTIIKFRPSKFKVFCIGYSKTATMSFNDAAKVLGFRASHWIHHGIEPKEGWIPYIKRQPFDVYSDMPFWHKDFYKVLDKEFPGSKFVLTLRDPDKLVKSWNRFFKLSPWEKTEEELVQLKKEYIRHVKEVKEYFKDRPNDLLVMNIFEGEGYEKLGPFLGKKKYPSGPFPHKNKHISVPLLRP